MVNLRMELLIMVIEFISWLIACENISARILSLTFENFRPTDRPGIRTNCNWDSNCMTSQYEKSAKLLETKFRTSRFGPFQ